MNEIFSLFADLESKGFRIGKKPAIANSFWVAKILQIALI